jgi:putative toxin-antitoxin system antitoxin component (TIGR02293 family)
MTSEKMLESIRIAAIELFEGDIESAETWLNTERKSFKNRKPIQMIRSDAEYQEVIDFIGRLEHGVFS